MLAYCLRWLFLGGAPQGVMHFRMGTALRGGELLSILVSGFEKVKGKLIYR